MGEEGSESERTLTDADVDAVLDRAFDRLRNAVGGGVLSLVWRALIICFIGLAAYGATKGH
ncbi:hypothetical protein [Paludibacterium yongneupense]|uniref:hypothetical protein n=1 Tax=Paludibacterium yongneupense TaxID=400061 RepID=UPI000411CF66|nr:hypothetical protein [Paludibacterium yongneupense]